ncbi:MAG: LamG domain-containing protein, partial [Victivallales bacterium]|nr:LamG domain-containing protein [Victivallales bacterium]
MRRMAMVALGVGWLTVGAAAPPRPVFQWPVAATPHEEVWRQGGVTRFAAAPTRVELTARSGLRSKTAITVPTAFTIEAVFRLDRRKGNLQIITSAVFEFAKDAPAFTGDRRLWCLEIRGEGKNLAPVGFLSLAIKGKEGQWHKLFSHGRVSPGWHHVIGVFDGAAMRLYLDGVPQTRTMRDGSERLPDGLLAPAGRSGLSVVVSDGAGRYAHGGYRGANNGLDGALASLRIHDRALSQAEADACRARAITQLPELAAQTPPLEHRQKAPFRVLYSNDFT